MILKKIHVNTRNWVNSTNDRVYWRALVNAALNLQVPYAIELVVREIIPCHVRIGGLYMSMSGLQRRRLHSSDQLHSVPICSP